MKTFLKKVDLRSRKEMIEYLRSHFRYNTMNSWNCSTSYANNVKIYNLGLEENYYSLDFMLDDIRESYEFDVTCQGSVPQAIKCFLEAKDFEDAIRNAVSLGGDCDTQAAMAGAIAEPFFGIPEKIKNKVFDYMDNNIKGYCDKYIFSMMGGEQDE